MFSGYLTLRDATSLLCHRGSPRNSNLRFGILEGEERIPADARGKGDPRSPTLRDIRARSRASIDRATIPPFILARSSRGNRRLLAAECLRLQMIPMTCRNLRGEWQFDSLRRAACNLLANVQRYTSCSEADNRIVCDVCGSFATATQTQIKNNLGWDSLELILVDVIPHVLSIRDIYFVKLNYHNARSFSRCRDEGNFSRKRWTRGSCESLSARCC